MHALFDQTHHVGALQTPIEFCYIVRYIIRGLPSIGGRLRQYMLTHTTLLILKMDPIKYIFEKQALSRRIARWKMILTEYDI